MKFPQSVGRANELHIRLGVVVLDVLMCFFHGFYFIFGIKEHGLKDLIAICFITPKVNLLVKPHAFGWLFLLTVDRRSLLMIVYGNCGRDRAGVVHMSSNSSRRRN